MTIGGMLSRLREAKRGLLRAEFVPPGHFYSPVTPHDERPTIANRLEERRTSLNLAGVDLRPAEQFELLQELSAFYSDLPFTDEPAQGARYYYNNPAYSFADAIFYASMLRRFRPRRIIEVGSGHSSTLALDVIDQFLDPATELTLIEPHPQVVEQLVPAADLRGRLIRARVQNLPHETFEVLESGDILFIDSTHVSRPGSDVNFLLLEILPLLKSGVLVHIHDIFYPFEYPAQWILEGRSWNEAYLLHAFLKFSPAFRIRLFTTFLRQTRAEWFAEHMPLCLRSPGGGIWLERTSFTHPTRSE